MIPLVDVAGRHARVAAEVERRVAAVLASGRWVGGPEVAACEAAVAHLAGRAHGVGVASGTDAEGGEGQGQGVGPGDEVIVPAVSFFATAGAVVRLGARPVIADVLDDRPLMDPDAARALVGPRTRAVVPVHLFGAAAPEPDLGLPVVDDAAQAAGSEPFPGRGAAAALSFYPTKVLGGAGDGGMVVTDDPALARRVRALGHHGAAGPHLHERVAGHVGGNSRLDAVQAAVVLAHLADLPARLARRRAIAAAYRAALGDLCLPASPGSNEAVFCLRHPERDRLADALARRGVATAVYYPRPLTEQPALAGLLRADQPPAPRAARFCAEALAIPCHVGMSDADVVRVIEAVREAA